MQVEDLESSSRELIFYSHWKIGYDKSTTLKKPPRDLIKPFNSKRHDYKVNQTLKIIHDGQIAEAKVKSVLEDKNLQVQLKDGTKIVFNPSADYNIDPHTANDKYTPAEELGFEKNQKLTLLYKDDFHPCTIKDMKNHILTLNIVTLDDQEFMCSIYDPIMFPLDWPSTQGLQFLVPKSYLKENDVKEEAMGEETVEANNR